MGAMTFDPMYEVAQRSFSKEFARYMFFFAIGIYLLVDFWNQTLQYEGFTHASATFTLASGVVVAITSLVDLVETWSVRQTTDERLEGIFIGIYSIMISWLGGQKMRDAVRNDSAVQTKSQTMPNPELYIIVGSFAAVFVAVLVAVHATM